MRTIYFANDHGGVRLKPALKKAVEEKWKIVDLGTDSAESTDYPDYAAKLANELKNNPDAFGVLICGSGIGISIAANRYSHIRCARVVSETDARLSRAHNDANVIAFGERVTGEVVAIEALKIFLDTAFEGGRHAKRLEKINCCVKVPL